MLNSVSGRRTRRSGYYLYYPPLGLCSMAGSLHAAGLRAEICDGMFQRHWPDTLLARVREQQPALVGVLCNTPTLPDVHGLIDALRDLRGQTGAAFKIIAGGAHVSCDPDIVPDLGADFGAVGDGEPCITALAKLLIDNKDDFGAVPGLIWNDGAQWRNNPPPPPDAVKNYPLPDRSVLDRDKYFNPFSPAPTTTVISARGCPFQCAFCCRSESMGAYRPRPVDAVLAEMQDIAAAGYGFVSVIDETFTYDRDRAAELCRGLKSIKTEFQWSCQTRADTVSEDVLSLMRDAGCINLSFGVEAGSADVRRGMDKAVTDDKFRRAFDLCRNLGITTNAFLMIGSPGEDRDHVMRTIDLARSLEPDYVVFNIATLFPGTTYYDQLLERGELDRSIWTRYMRGDIPLPVLSKTMDKAELVRLLNLAYRSFYLRPRYILKRLNAVRSPRSMWHLARQGLTVVGDYVLPGVR